MNKRVIPHSPANAAPDAPLQLYFPPRFVYLAGPILGCNVGEANDWRKYVADALRPHNIIGMSPLRCEPLIGEHYSADYPDPRFGTPRAIAAKNKFDVGECDMTLAMFPKPPPGRHQSFGTIGEIFWADEGNKRVILVSDDPDVICHPVIDSACDWKFITGDAKLAGHGSIILDSFQQCVDYAIDTIVGVLGGYAGGKNV